MAPFDSPYSSNLTNKISPLLEGQVPDFIQADHPVFVKFLKSYFEYLEAGELRVSVVIDNLLLELETESFVLDSDDNKVVLEDATDATTGKFIVGETITGSTSKATATILVDDLGNSTKPRLFITGQQQFQTGETITGGTSGSTGTVVRYRANPVQNIQQLLEYANVDNTIYDFLDQLRDSFMNAIPKELAAGVDQRNLIKNIRELYRAKGTSEGHKIFMRMLLDENIEVTYPNQYMMRVSDGDWSNQTIIRCSPGANAAGGEMIGQVITGQTSGSTAVVANALSTAEGGEAITEFEINPASLTGTFTDGEVVQGTSTVQDVTMSFTIRGIVTSYAVTDGGKLYSVGDDLNLDTQTTIGNGEASAEVGSIKTGSVSRVIIDDVGANYRVGDTLTFTTTESGTTTKASTGFVSVVDGSLAINGTDSSSSDAGDNLVLESGSTSAFIEFDIGLEDETGVFLLNRTTAAGANAGEKIIVEPATDIQFTLDSYGTDSDTFALESGTVATGEIARVFLKDGGEGYSLLPSVAVTSTNGTGAVLTADTNDIGVVDSVNVTKQGFKYTEAPEGRFVANFLLKDVTGTFGETNTLASSGHTGVVKSFNSTTKVLKTTFEDVQRITMETSDSEGIGLEDSLVVLADRAGETDLKLDNIIEGEGNTLLEDATAGVGRKILLDGTAEVGIDQLVLNGTDGSSTNAGSFIISEGSNDGDSYVNGSGVKFVTEQVTSFTTVENEGESLSINNSITLGSLGDMRVLLDGTDSSGTDAGDNIIGENTGNSIVLNGTDGSSSHATDRLLSNVEALSGSIAIDGTNSSSASAGDNIVNEQPPDFSAEGTTITDSGGASGTIVSVDIAKGTTSIGTKAETVPSYGVSIKSLIGEDLNRIQDSVYYQQFSYEIEAASSQADYLTELKKAIHPAGFNVFGKVSIATLVSAAIPTAGASLGGGFTSNFSPILASTFTILFSEEVSRATGVMEYGVNNFDDEILLEDDNFTPVGTKFLVENEEGGDDEIILEEYHNPTVFAGDVLSLENGFGQIIVEESLSNAEIGNRLISETGVEVTHDLLLEPEGTVDGGNLFPGVTLSKTYFLLDGTDSSSSNAGDRFISEDAPSAKLLAEPIGDTNSLLNEDGGNQYLETAGKGDVSNKEINVISRVTSKIHLPNKNSSSLPNGLITMGESPFGNDPSAIDLEIGTVGGSGSGKLVLVGFEQINEKGGVNRVTGSNEGLLFEDAVDDNVGSGFAFDDFGSYDFSHTMVLDGTDGSSTNAGDNITLESGVVDLHGNYSGGSILGEVTFNHSYMSIEDIIRPARFLADIDGGLNLVNIVMEQDEIGSFKQEDGTTVSSTHGDSFLLEDGVGVGYNNKIILEKQYLIPEDEVITTTSHGFDLKGVIPSENYTNSDIEPYTYTSDVVTRPIDTLVLEDLGKEATNILLESSGTEGLDMAQESGVAARTAPDTGINLESTLGDKLLLNGTDGSGTNDGENLKTERTFEALGNLVYDATGTDADDNIINENSTIGIDGYNLGTFQGGANFLLDRTAASGNFTNVGEEVLLETATFYETINKTGKLSVPLTFEFSFDSTLNSFDNLTKTFDSTV